MPSAAETPYKFFEFYTKNDRGIFAGRLEEVEVLIADIVSARLVVLFARTGTGKSSLINAGVRPRLEDLGFVTALARTGRDPASSLVAALRSEGLIEPNAALEPLPVLLPDIVKRSGTPLAIFFDQFEEIFQDENDAALMATQQAFIRTIGELYKQKTSGVHIVFSLREDFLGHMDAFRDAIPTIYQKESQLRLRFLTTKQAREAIVVPSVKFSEPFTFEEGLIDQIIADLPKQSGNLILPVHLQIVCDTLWRGLEAATITRAQYETAGGAQGILKKRFVDELRTLDGRALRTLEKILPDLSTEQETKKSHRIADMASIAGLPVAAVQHCVDEMCKRHLFRMEVRESEQYFEWVSDYLAKESRTLRPVVRRLWLTQHETTPSVERARELMADTELTETFDRGDWLGLLKAVAPNRDALRQWFQSVKPRTVAWDLLSEVLRSTTIEESAAQTVIRFLGELDADDDHALHLLETQIEGTPERARAAIRALGAMNDERAVDIIEGTDRGDVQGAAVDALGAIATPRAKAAAKRVNKRGGSILGDLFRGRDRLRGMVLPDGWRVLRETLRTGDAAAVIGPGVIEQSGAIIARDLAERFEYPFGDAENLHSVVDYVNIAFGGAKRISNVSASNQTYDALARSPFRTFLTFDYSLSLEAALEKAGRDAAVRHLLGRLGRPGRVLPVTRSDWPCVVTFGFNSRDLLHSAARQWIFPPGDVRTTIVVMPEPTLTSDRFSADRAHDYYERYAQERGTMFYFGEALEFLDELQSFGASA